MSNTPYSPPALRKINYHCNVNCLTSFVLEPEAVAEAADQLAAKSKRIYLVDSGLVFNSPYPLLLRPQRTVDIFLSFDFSARKKDDEMPFKVIWQ